MNKGDKDVSNWLTQQDGDWPLYFLGEQHRKKNRLAQARLAVGMTVFATLKCQKMLVLKRFTGDQVQALAFCGVPSLPHFPVGLAQADHLKSYESFLLMCL